MSKLKNIVIDTQNEIDGLSKDELIKLLIQKNRELGYSDELFSFLSNQELISLIYSKNLLLTSNTL